MSNEYKTSDEKHLDILNSKANIATNQLRTIEQRKTVIAE